jgi:hypothetical protein
VYVYVSTCAIHARTLLLATTARLCATVVKKKPPSNDVVIGASSSDVATGPRPWISRRTRPCFDRRGRACDRGRRHWRTRDVHGRLPPARRRRRVPDAWRGEAGVETASPPRTAAVRGAEAEAHPGDSALPAVPAVPGDTRLDWHPGKPRTAPSGRCRTHRRAGTSRARPARGLASFVFGIAPTGASAAADPSPPALASAAARSALRRARRAAPSSSTVSSIAFRGPRGLD